MAGETPPNRRGRKRGARGRLRKAQEIDRVHVHQPFELHLPDHAVEAGERKAGEGCYVSTTIHNRRYYGVLIDQAALTAASMLHFQNEAAGLELNRKIELLKQQKLDQEQSVADRKRHADSDASLESDRKRIHLAECAAKIPGDKQTSEEVVTRPGICGRPVQKFRYVNPVPANEKAPASPGYRILLATYADATVAADDDPEKAKLIEAACRVGGGYVGTQHYFQYEQKCENLQPFDPESKTSVADGLRMSLGFHSFLELVALPDWFPLANLQVGQSKVLSLLNMKKDNNGNVIYDGNAASLKMDLLPAQPSAERISMEPRSCFRVCVVGGGVAGLSCCLEIFRICEKEKIEVEVVLVEGRSRLGGRLWTDRETFKTSDGKSFPVDLGASWIHGIDQNPMAALAKEAGADFITTSEDVKMFQTGGEEVDTKKDEQAGELFDKLLDFAANDCWALDDSSQTILTKQSAVRWYASVLGDSFKGSSNSSPLASRPPSHRQSSDMSIDHAIGRAILKHKLSEFSILSDEERRMLVWNLKNIEYALGANVKDLSMQWWDIDEHHAFEGDHVLLKQGYSTVIDHLHCQLRKRGDRFQCKLGFAVGTIDYNRKTSTSPPPSRGSRGRKFIELSDTCCVSSQDGTQTVKCDFVVSAVPLGVLKASLVESEADHEEPRLSFEPPLPFLKRDAIESVGFGLLNKVYLQFAFPFWRKQELVGPKYAQFGNASGVHPHHYMFLDVGRILEGTLSSPAILMSLISGREATMCERLSDELLVEQVMETLKTLFSNIEVPSPITFKVTRWGSDQFSRGCYTFLTPGTTDQDFGVLQTPVNGNGDSLLLEGSETMRLFFAGEHTTALHPSMAHGALMSGIRVAKEVVEAMNVSLDNNDDSIDKLMPMAMFRYLNPKRDIRCCLCHKSGMRIREGNLLVYRKGSRQVLVHTNCAEYSPEVEVFEGQWKDVFTAVNRSRNSECFLCKLTGATIGCAYRNCDRCYHFSCGEDTGWRFATDGKEFYCDLHRSVQTSGSESSRVSLTYFQSKSQNCVACALCDKDDDTVAGELLAFQRYQQGKEELIIVHEKCLRNTSIMDVGEEKMSHLDKEFRNVFAVVDRSRTNECPACMKMCASVLCADAACVQCFHVPCAEATGWKFDKQGTKFRCAAHRNESMQTSYLSNDGQNKSVASAIPEVKVEGACLEKNDNEANGVIALLDGVDDDASEVLELTISSVDQPNEEIAWIPSEIPLALRTARRRGSRWVPMLVRLARKSVQDRWSLELFATCLEGSQARILTVAATVYCPVDPLEEGDIVRAINGVKVGSTELSTLGKVFAFLRREVELVLEIHRQRKQDNPWV